ncbi:MAG: RnfABCDGE type electron transport complex subunit G [Candidatus Omnitrophica bacterium]|nr:RnfABCDGE type electron transport complex subunit G [Candidatus Omnitrophota bacterium]
MRKAIHIILVLTVVGLISGASLVFVYRYAKPLIAENQRRETKEAIFKVFPKAHAYEKVKKDDEEIFLVKDKRANDLGYAFIAEGNGYQGKIKLMVGIKTDLITLSGIEILESQETPGLGQEITERTFKKQFINLKTLPFISYVKGKQPEKENEIQAITGATISSKAVVSILNEKIKKIRAVIARSEATKQSQKR